MFDSGPAGVPAPDRAWNPTPTTYTRSESLRRAYKFERETLEGMVAAGMSTREIGEMVGVSPTTAFRACRKFGIKLSDVSKPLPAEVQRDIIARYLAKDPSTAIAKSLGIHTATVCRVLQRNGIPIRSITEQRTRHPLRHDAFDVLTPDAAYWCGMLFTDGTVRHRPSETPEVALVLTASDRAHIEKLRTFLGSTHAITDIPRRPVGRYISQPACSYSVRSRQLADRLCALGRYEGSLDPQLARSRDFWRGAVDGDGSIHHDRAEIRLAGSLRLLTYFAAFVGEVIGRVPNVNPNRMIYNVGLACAPAESVVRVLYAGATTALTRKADVAAKIIAAS